MVFHWSLSDSKSPQVSRTRLRILAVLSKAVIWIVSTPPATSKSSRLFNNPLVIVPKASITIGIIVTFMFYSFFQFSSKVEVLILLPSPPGLIIIIPYRFLIPALADSLSIESNQVSTTLLNIQADLNCSLNGSPISIPSSPLTQNFVTVPSAPITMSIRVGLLNTPTDSQLRDMALPPIKSSGYDAKQHVRDLMQRWSFGNAEYLFIVIAERFTLVRSGSTW